MDKGGLEYLLQRHHSLCSNKLPSVRLFVLNQYCDYKHGYCLLAWKDFKLSSNQLICCLLANDADLFHRDYRECQLVEPRSLHESIWWSHRWNEYWEGKKQIDDRHLFSTFHLKKAIICCMHNILYWVSYCSDWYPDPLCPRYDDIYLAF